MAAWTAAWTRRRGRRQRGGFGYPAAMLDRYADPRTEDTIVYELLRTARGADGPEVVGRATFRDGRSSVDAPEGIAVAVQELLARPFVDRIQADERPRGYRRSGRGIVDMLVPGMPEHFIARLRGLWLPYPDGSVVTARPAGAAPAQPTQRPTFEPSEASAPITDPSVRRATLAESGEILHARPLVRANEPPTGVRPAEERTGLARTDCGWLV
jgi:hypothetical protein